jgi:hypothetical protein
MTGHLRTRSGKYPNLAYQFQCCTSFILDSSFGICHRSTSIDRVWFHTHYTNLLHLKLESHRLVHLTQTLENNLITTFTNHSKPDPLDLATSPIPSNPTIQKYPCRIPQHHKTYFQKVAHTATSTHPAYTKYTQICHYHTPTLLKQMHKQHPDAPTQVSPHRKPDH